MSDKKLILALHSLKEDAGHAWQELLGGDDRGLGAVGQSMKLVEAAVIERDAERRNGSK